MKKLNAKGFTLIELLAVITIMGILMMVAIPTVSRTIENSRKDTFIDTVGQYVNGVKNMWAADSLECKVTEGGVQVPYVSSAVPNGFYYIEINTAATSGVPVLLEQGGKSPWGSRHIAGNILIEVKEVDGTRKVIYYPTLVDGIHGINVKSDGAPKAYGSDLEANNDLTRGDIVMTGATYDKVTNSATIAAGSTVTAPTVTGKTVYVCEEI